MFRVTGKNRQDHNYHVRMIEAVGKLDMGAGIILAAVYFEWCVTRCIMALGRSSVAEIRRTISEECSNFDDIVDLWRAEVVVAHSNIPIIPEVFDKKKKKQSFRGRVLTWDAIKKARKSRNELVHGKRCDPLEKHGRKHLDILLAASGIIAELAEVSGHSIFRVVRRKAGLANQ